MKPEKEIADAARRVAPRPASAVSVKERKCVKCRRAIPAGEKHIYDGGDQRWHAECYRAENG